jgi:NAD+ synthase (glutamine-hydrolysing)
MKLVRVAAAVVNQTPLDWEGNRRNISAALQEARKERAAVVCFPELCISGYNCEDAFQSHDVLERSRRLLLDLAQETEGLIASFGLPLLYRNAIFNTACLVCDGKILGFVAKQFLAGDGIHYEPRWFKPWSDGARGRVALDGGSYPIGDLFFDCGGVRLGYEICEDAWVARRPGADLARQGVDVILNPSASHFAFGKLEIRKRFVLEGSRAFGLSYVYANLLGNESGRSIYDGGALIASGGRLLTSGPRFSFADWQLTTAVIDVDETRMAQARTGSFAPELREEPGACVPAPFEFPEVAPDAPAPAAAWEEAADIKEEEFTRAVSLALFDYLRKSRSNGFVISLSGGADSAAAAVLVSTMCELAVRELGASGAAGKLGHVAALREARTARDFVRALLTCVYQATANSSATTRNAARAVASAVSAEFLELDVQHLVDGYVRMVSRTVGRPLTWDEDDVTLQNIQARVRAPGAWMLANIKGALLLATSNRSEAAVGYATMDGDTAGGLSPIGGIDKAFLRRWLSWMETEGPDGLRPIPELSAVNVQAPTAELRPPGEHQTDESDLMPYPVLDAIERAAIRDKHSPVEVFHELLAAFPEHPDARLGAWIERFFRLWCRNQWKRERYAPSFHLDDENLDPKTWCRFPILSGGFEVELAELRRELARRARSTSAVA